MNSVQNEPSPSSLTHLNQAQDVANLLTLERMVIAGLDLSFEELAFPAHLLFSMFRRIVG